MLNGAVLRLDPATGLAARRQSRSSASSDPNAQRIIAYGFRNPVPLHDQAGHQRALDRRRRLDHLGGDRPDPDRPPRPSQLRLALLRGTVRAATVRGATRHLPGALQTGPATAPFFAYKHWRVRRRRRRLPDRQLVDRGIDVLPGGGNYPSSYDGALFFSDYTRKCMWVMFPDADGPARPRRRVTGLRSTPRRPVDLTIGPDGDLFYVDFDDGHDPAVTYTGSQPPIAASTAPDDGRRAADGRFRRHGLESRPRRHAHVRVGPRRRRGVRRLDRPRSRRTPTTRRERTRSA